MSVLIGKHVMEILGFVESHNPCQKSMIYTAVGQTNTTTGIINELISMGALTETKMGRHNLKSISISEKGLEILETLRTLHRLENEGPRKNGTTR